MAKRFCERCEKITQDGHLWCPDKDCPAEQGFPVFDYGDYVADLKVVRLIAMWRTAALYEAQRAGKTVWLKVAHSDRECEERVRREAEVLRAVAPGPRSFLQTFSTAPRLNYLAWLPPLPTPTDRAFGEVTIDGVTRAFSVFSAQQGSLLSDLLLENPNLWHYEAAWIASTVSDAMQLTLSKGWAHLSLTPDMIYVEPDREGHLRAALLDLGWCLGGRDVSESRLREIASRAVPAYAAPEILSPVNAAAISPAADTYTLGLILYEMLAGHPGFTPTKIPRDEQVKRRVLGTKTALFLERPELGTAKVPELVARAISPRERYASVADFSKAIVSIYGPPPPEKLPRPTRAYVAVGMLGTLLAAVLISGMFVLLRAAGG